MRNRAPVRRTDDGQGRQVRLAPAQVDLLSRATAAFGELLTDPQERQFVLGAEGETLTELFAGEYSPNRSLDLPVTEAQLHAAYALLTTLLVLLPKERTFMERVGYFRENAADVALGLRRGFARRS